MLGKLYNLKKVKHSLTYTGSAQIEVIKEKDSPFVIQKLMKSPALDFSYSKK